MLSKRKRGPLDYLYSAWSELIIDYLLILKGDIGLCKERKSILSGNLTIQHKQVMDMGIKMEGKKKTGKWKNQSTLSRTPIPLLKLQVFPPLHFTSLLKPSTTPPFTAAA
ncbi:hypothetical protein H5410_025705 [Solanum commersonii]|uniref:Uncharacterized protein n=1 Tax=Solanum commersonii TaxID=4109 RepID=A0A9J5YWL7_SOLCO|nr:hypothetical protein H5410_025705 [Solanum commersonii]